MALPWLWTGRGRLRWALIPAGLLLLLALPRGLASLWGPWRSDDARLLVPSLPVVPSVQAVVALEYGRLGHLFVREGAPVAPGEPLFSLERDPSIDQELVDRGFARDLADLTDQMRDARREIDGLQERMAITRSVEQPMLNEQIGLARARLQRREQLWRTGGVSRDLVDEARERLLRVQQERLDREQDQVRLRSLQRLLDRQQQRWRRLSLQQAALRHQDQRQRDIARQHPNPGLLEQDRLNYATYRASGRGVLLRVLKRPGDPVRPREAVAIWQRDQQPPQVEALLSSQGTWLWTADQRARVEIPSLRQVYSARLLSWRPADRGRLRLRFGFEAVPPSEVRRLLALPGEPVRLELPRQLNLVHWLQTGRLSPALAP